MIATDEQGAALEGCPFCGRKAVIEEFREDDDPQPLFVVTCEVCPVKTYDQFSAQEAARVWNSRDGCRALERKVLDAVGWWHAEINRTRSTSVLHVRLEEFEQGLFRTFSELLDARYQLNFPAKDANGPST